MSKNLDKVCRVCMLDGSRNIFKKKTFASTCENSATAVSSLDKLLEKLRYVTLIKIDESDNLPVLLCDLCIIQLNVAYNFKRQAVETDTKLRQYIIENGLTITHIPHSANGNEDNEKSTPTPSDNSFQQRPFTATPFMIKTEPLDYDTLSDITIETNTEMDDNLANNYHRRNNQRGIPFNNDIQPIASVSAVQQHTQLMSQSMVRVNDDHLLKATAHSDIEFINNYLPAGSINDCSPHSSTGSSTHSSLAQKPLGNQRLIVASAKVNRYSNISKETSSGKPITQENHRSENGNVSNVDQHITANIRSRKRKNELEKITKIDFNFKPERISVNRAYTLRNKGNETNAPNYNLFSRKKRLINPANRLRSQIKTEILSQSLPSTQSASNTSTNIADQITEGKNSVINKNLTEAIEKQRAVPSDSIKMKAPNEKQSVIPNGSIKVKTVVNKGNPPAKIKSKCLNIANDDLFSFPSKTKLTVSTEPTKNRNNSKQVNKSNANFRNIKKTKTKPKFHFKLLKHSS